MRRGNFFITLAAAALAAFALATSCIEPLKLVPDIEGDIVAFEVEGQIRSSINTSTRTVSIEVGEGGDLSALRVTRLELVETASCDISTGDVLDLSSPLRVNVTTATNYEWIISATRLIDERRPLPGGDFDEWHQVGKVWNPWPASGVWEQARWWDTGNSALTLIGASNSTPTEAGEGSPANPSGRAARLESKWALMKAAGGNIFFGRFGGLDGVNAKCDMGHPWSAKPRGLKGWYKYFPQPIDQVHGSYVGLHPYGFSRDQWMGKSDSLSVTVALWASPDGGDVPFVVNTAPRGPFVDLTRDKEGIIAWGQFTSGDEQAEWREFSLDVEYLRPEYLSDDVPLPINARLIVTVTSSKQSNYFIAGTSGGGADGKTGSLMFVDELELIYD
ncbi:MAG: PCMD domain-containing protein [Alistipes sp.]|jgi:hypothetical protein|nr:PCMD domain-containing protein [Alistipes sp.]